MPNSDLQISDADFGAKSTWAREFAISQNFRVILTLRKDTFPTTHRE